MGSISDARLKDVISKSSVYAGKKNAHDAARSSNKILKDVEHDSNSKSFAAELVQLRTVPGASALSPDAWGVL